MSAYPVPTETRAESFSSCPPATAASSRSTATTSCKGTMNNYNVMVRGIVVNNDLPGGAARQEDAGLPVE